MPPSLPSFFFSPPPPSLSLPSFLLFLSPPLFLPFLFFLPPPPPPPPPLSLSLSLWQWRLWLLTLGFTLSFGALFAKTWQVYRVYTNPKLKKEVSEAPLSSSLSPSLPPSLPSLFLVAAGQYTLSMYMYNNYTGVASTHVPSSPPSPSSLPSCSLLPGLQNVELSHHHGHFPCHRSRLPQLLDWSVPLSSGHDGERGTCVCVCVCVCVLICFVFRIAERLVHLLLLTSSTCTCTPCNCIPTALFVVMPGWHHPSAH